MSNIIITPKQIALTSAAIAGLDMGLARLVNRDVENDYRGSGVGDTVKVRIPGAPLASTRGNDSTTALVTASVNEQSIDVVLDTEVYSRVLLSDADLDLNLVSYTAQIAGPQARSIATHVERTLTTALTAVPLTAGIVYSATKPAAAFTALRKQLRANGVGSDATIHAVVGIDVYAHLLDAVPATAGVTFDENGLTIRGVRVHESSRIAADAIVAFVPEAFMLVVRAPIAPAGAPFSASVRGGKDNEFAVRLIRAFDSTVGAEASLLTSFVAVKAMPLAVDNEDGTVSLVPSGGAVRIDTAA